VKRIKWESVFFWTIAIASYLRIYFGIGHTDEIQYVTSAALESLGGKPFVNEGFIQQIASLMTSPVINAYIKLRGSTDGLVLFNRHLYFAIFLSAAILFRHTLDQVFPNRTWESVLGALGFLVYTHNTMPSLSYNTVAIACISFALSLYGF
jgi:hypothetical protein